MTLHNPSPCPVGRPIIAHLITTGSELLHGHTLNTHPEFLARELWQVGVEIDHHVTVPDGEVIADEVRRAIVSADIVIVTGGLGPTSDDITRDCVAAALGVEMHFDPEIDRGISDYLKQRGIEVRSEQSRQAMVPDGAEAIENRRGTAPGLIFDDSVPGDVRCRMMVVLPGPPLELEPMVTEALLPRIERWGHGGDVTSVMRLVGVGEADVAAALDSSLRAVNGLRFGYCARVGEVDVRCVGDSSAVGEARALVESTFGGQVIDGPNLAGCVIDRLRCDGMMISTAESCTGGAITSALTDVAGASDVVDCGFVTYSNESKVRMLCVSDETLDRFGAVSGEICSQMVAGALAESRAGVAVACTGIAGPLGGTDEKPVGTVFIGVGLVGRDPVVERCYFPSERSVFKQRVVVKALDMVRRLVAGQL